MPRTKVMLIGALPAQAGFPGAGGPNQTYYYPAAQPAYRMNRHAPIPSVYDEPQNLLKIGDKTNYNPHARASGGAAITSALSGVGSVGRGMISPFLGAVGDAAPEPTYDDYKAQAEAWKYTAVGGRAALALLGGAMAALHGYRRNKGATGWAVVWGLAGAVFPLVTNGVALVQGYGKP